jgi:hypothetical protein
MLDFLGELLGSVIAGLFRALGIEVLRGVDKTRGRGAPLVTSVGVIAILVGLLQFFGCGCFSIMSLSSLYASVLHPGHGIGRLTGFAICMVLALLILSLLYLISGIGVLRRRHWGRLMTMVLVGISLVAGTFITIGYLKQSLPKKVGIVVSLPFWLHGITSFAALLIAKERTWVWKKTIGAK